MPQTFLVLSAVVLSWTSTAALRPFLTRRGLVDDVNHRSSHTVATLRGGGLSVLLTIALISTTATAFGPTGVGGEPLFATGICAVAGIGLLGWWEDIKGLPVATRFILQSAISVVVVLFVATFASAPAAVLCAAALGAVFYVNAANFMDGVNGLSSLHAVVVGIYVAMIATGQELHALAIFGLCGAGAFLGFLPWNVPRARLFLGDVGSYTLGAFVWFSSFWIAVSGAALIVALAPLAIYAADVLLTLTLRGLRREPLAQAHREHVYQLLQQKTQSHGIASGTVTTFTLFCCSVGWLTNRGSLSNEVAILALLILAVMYCSLRMLIAPAPRSVRAVS